ncbi:hypothetical protein H6P87_00651 [Rickettsia tillamookensis]|uniref:Ankyrin repeat protein n=1 Tax=Rickettsia tillamookensis TaxID=2761623 RepID=A0A9E6MHU5_9RICK|nr:ankyrin repeat domain-containing protein [Rickettsia tillamookensis]QQV75106.1 hypothetical protein H6P87_00651 [Rickettsia tillamookensis]
MPKKKVYSFEKLIKAIRSKNEVNAQELIAQMDTTELSKVDDYGNTALIVAIRNKLEKICEILISKMSDEAINQPDNNHDTALYLAIFYNLEKVCELLIPRMSDETINYRNVLKDAASKGFERVCEMLIPKVSYYAIDSSDEYGNTALSLAIKYGFKNIYNLLYRVKYQKLANELHNKIVNNTEVSAKDKAIMIDTIKDISQKIKLLTSKVDRGAVEASMRLLLNDKLTKLKFMIIDEQVDKLIEQQNINFNQLATKINIFQESVNDITSIIINDTTISAKNKLIMEGTVKDITDKTAILYSAVEIEKITIEMQKLIVDKPTKVKLMTIEEQVDELIENQHQDMINDINVLGDYSNFG